MKAMAFHQYGSPDVLALEEVPKPTPQPDEVLIKVHASSINAGDWHLLRADPFLVRLVFGLLKPKSPFLGTDVAGIVEAVGANVTQFKPGNEVFGDLTDSGFGGFAEYTCAKEKTIALKSPRMSFEQAAAFPSAGLTALQGLRDEGKLQAGEKVLVNGASGGVGSFAVQIAKALGAEVTAVCSTKKMEMVGTLGADHLIDYTQEDFTTSGKQYDMILDTAAFRSILDYRSALTPEGRYVQIGGGSFLRPLIQGAFVSLVSRQKMGTMLVAPNQEDLRYLRELFETGKVAPAIDKTYPLQEVPDAIRAMENRQVQGKLVVTI